MKRDTIILPETPGIMSDAASRSRTAISAASAQLLQIGVDVGGTFTDFVCQWPDGTVRLFKLPTTHGDPCAAISSALARMGEDWSIEPAHISRFLHGTTVATNAAIEQKGVKVGLLMTEGFTDVFEIGRQARKDMYNLELKAPAPLHLAPREQRCGIRERIGADGSIITPLCEESLAAALESLLQENVEAIAVSYLFSFLNPAHEIKTRDFILDRAPQLSVSLSSEVDPAFREFERTCVTAFDAYVKPIVRDYLHALQNELERGGVAVPLQVIQSRGGLTRIETACERPVRLFLSGPAGGVIGARAVARANRLDHIITVDIGGTSSDIALISEGTPLLRHEGVIDGFPVRVPMVDVTAIGAGGGSIAWIDGIGALRVGPHSAGSEPGPACYGRGGREPTVTDASIILGYIDPDYFAGGNLGVCAEKARAAIEERIAAPLGLGVEAAAYGIHRVINGQMAEGIRLVSVRRGIDPRQFALIMLGGAGAIHGTALARELGISTVVIPLFPGVLAAYGLLSAPVEHEVSTSVQTAFSEYSLDAMHATLSELDARCACLMQRENVVADSVRVRHFADVCYVGQSYYLEVPLISAKDESINRIYCAFLAEHERVYGHAIEKPAKFANLRSVHFSESQVSDRVEIPYTPVDQPAQKGSRIVVLDEKGSSAEAQVWRRTALPVSQVIAGPAVVEQDDSTILIEPGWSGQVQQDGTLILSRRELC